MPIGFGEDYGNQPYGSSYYLVEVTLRDSSIVEVEQVTEEEACRERLFNKLISNIPRFWRRTARKEGTQSRILFEMAANYLCEFLEDFKVALLEINLLMATGSWLNLWGKYFNAKRYANEADTIYRLRILSVLKNPKCTTRAILDRINPYLYEEPQSIEYMYSGIPFSSAIPDSVEDFDWRRARCEFVLKQAEPSEHYFFVDYSFINREAYEPGLEAYEAYVFDNERIGKTAGSFGIIKEIVKKTKLAGVRVFYRMGTTYIR